MSVIEKLIPGYFKEWPDEYVWRCSMCGAREHGTKAETNVAHEKHKADAGHDISFTRYPLPKGER